jgi:hypothetical protein
MPPDTCFTGIAEGVRDGPWSRGLHAECGFLHNIDLAVRKVESPAQKQKRKNPPMAAGHRAGPESGRVSFGIQIFSCACRFPGGSFVMRMKGGHFGGPRP